MKKIVLLGDSIRLIGYGTKVPQLLGDHYEVFQPEDNCRFAKYTLRMIFELHNDIKDADVIHWNNGLWDICDIFGDGKLFTSKEEYTETILRIAELLKRITPNVIFATTTPVHPDNIYNKNESISQYNELIVPELKKIGIKINDLYAVVAPHIKEYIREDDLIHLTDKGIDATAAEVVRAIKQFDR